ncbi:MAG: cation diffusion facilitator family transporter [Candidatus Rokuibacteriota bacterium]
MHTHGGHGSRHKHRLRAVLALTVGFLGIELATALWTGSLSMLADAVHLLADAGGVLLSLVAIWFAERPATSTKTYGYYRVEIFAALINGVVLCVLALVILWKAYERLWRPPEVPGGPMMVIALVGLAANLVALRLLHAGAHESLNVRGAYLEVLGDALSSVAVLVAGAVIALTGWTHADPLAAVAIGFLILPRTAALLSQAVNVLLEGVPPHLDLGEIERAMEEVDGVRRVHDLHVWTLTSGREAMSAHVVVAAGVAADRLQQDLHLVLHARFGIDHTTIQVEPEAPALVQITPGPRAG